MLKLLPWDTNGGLPNIEGNAAADPAETVVPAQSTPVVPTGQTQYASKGPLCKHWPPCPQFNRPMMLPVVQTASEIIILLTCCSAYWKIVGHKLVWSLWKNWDTY